MIAVKADASLIEMSFLLNPLAPSLLTKDASKMVDLSF